MCFSKNAEFFGCNNFFGVVLVVFWFCRVVIGVMCIFSASVFLLDGDSAVFGSCGRVLGFGRCISVCGRGLGLSGCVSWGLGGVFGFFALRS